MAAPFKAGLRLPIARKAQLAAFLAKFRLSSEDVRSAGESEGTWRRMLICRAPPEPSQLTSEEMQHWAADFDAWTVCDGCCCNLFDRTPLGWKKAAEWIRRHEEYVKRAAFSIMAGLVWKNPEVSGRLPPTSGPPVSAGGEQLRP